MAAKKCTYALFEAICPKLIKTGKAQFKPCLCPRVHICMCVRVRARNFFAKRPKNGIDCTRPLNGSAVVRDIFVDVPMQS